MDPTVRDATSPREQILSQLQSGAAQGDSAKVARMLKALKTGLDERNEQGWTAIMLASRNGHADVVKLLLDCGCDPLLRNKSGQNSLDIAEFWDHSSVVSLLRSDPQAKKAAEKDVVNFFGVNPLDRQSHRRTDRQWLDDAMRDPTTTYVLYRDLNPYVTPSESSDGSFQYALAAYTYGEISFALNEAESSTVFLGVGPVHQSLKASPKQEQNGGEGQQEEGAWFALDVTSIPEEKMQEVKPEAEALSRRNRLALMTLREEDAGIIAQGRSMLAWHDRYKFCPTCGAKTTMADAGYKRICTIEGCRSLKGVHNTCYPRLDPVAIMLVVSEDGKSVLLGRKKGFPGKMYSCLAGFMEPGETIEDAVRREVKEESGIIVGKVQYHSSQPWPMPSQLMIGCIAQAVSSKITVDMEELEDARWFTRHEVVEMLGATSNLGAGSGMFVPPGNAIAHQLIKHWARMAPSL
ncbi:NAD-capped RNA hydrolase NUDT12-like [Diadema setosum]|uniref:NAD-capped RNA hydrolase NUDT12-like n=1 Tax=Diadema setosum TaxID=31175 RepID=UPI003B3BE3FB